MWKNQKEKELEAALLSLRLDDLEAWLQENSSSLWDKDKPFASYMRGKFKEKGVKQKEVFARAHISQNYGYKLISQEKHTSRRDTIIKLGLSLGMTVPETQRALVLSGFSELHIYVKRDVILMALINNKINNMNIVNEYLDRFGQDRLYEGKGEK